VLTTHIISAEIRMCIFHSCKTRNYDITQTHSGHNCTIFIAVKLLFTLLAYSISVRTAGGKVNSCTCDVCEVLLSLSTHRSTSFNSSHTCIIIEVEYCCSVYAGKYLLYKCFMWHVQYVYKLEKWTSTPPHQCHDHWCPLRPLIAIYKWLQLKTCILVSLN